MTLADSRPGAGSSAGALARVLIPLLALCLVGCAPDERRLTLRGETMGTTWSVVYTADSSTDQDVLRAALAEELRAMNAVFSTYIESSEISRLNRAGTSGFSVSADFAEVLELALAVAAAAGGAYDISVGPLVDLWGFGSEIGGVGIPPRDAINAALARVGVDRLDWEPDSRTVTMPEGMRLDLSSIAKGYAVDRLADVLREVGVERYLVEIGGELRSSGERPGGGPWRLAIESPDLAGGRAIDALAVTDAAVATSGDYRNFFMLDGVRYSHLVDPRTGYPVTHDLVSVTVVSDRCAEADAWATALIVLGRDAALRVAREQNLAAYLVARDGEQLTVDYTDDFARFLAANTGLAPGA